MGGLGLDLMTSAGTALADHTWLGIIFGIGAILALWGIAPRMADTVRPVAYKPRGSKMLPIATMVAGVIIFGAGAVWFYLSNPSAMTAKDLFFSGGSGGKASASAGGAAIGGAGGAGGDLGHGGPGGDAKATGPGSFALGGEGGEGARSNRAAKGGRGPFDVLNHPDRDMVVPGTNMRLGDFGKGGDGAPPAKK